MEQQDWFASNAPKTPPPSSGDDWFAKNQPTVSATQEKPGLLQRIQNSFDENTAYHADDPALKKFITGAVQAVGAPIVHPLDTISGAIKSLDVTPAFSSAPKPQQSWSDAAKQLPYVAGQATGGVAGGEVGGQVVGTALRAAGPIAGRMALLGKTPEGAYESALKPSTALSPAERAAAIDTGLKQGIPISKGGLEKLNDQIETLNQAIKDEISKDPNRPIDPNKVATRADAAKARFVTQVNAQPDLTAIEASRQQFLNEQGQTPGTPAQPTGVLDAQGKPIMSPAQPPTAAPPMSAADAQAMKQGTYRVLKGKFGEQGSASVEAQKSLARGLKEEIASAFPEIGKLNADESRLLELQPLLERAVNRISNHQAMGLGTPAAGVAAEAMGAGSGTSAAVMVLKSVLDNPGIKSRLAIAVSKGAKIPYAKAFARVAAYSESLGAMQPSPQESTNGDIPNQQTTSNP